MQKSLFIFCYIILYIDISRIVKIAACRLQLVVYLLINYKICKLVKYGNCSIKYISYREFSSHQGNHVHLPIRNLRKKVPIYPVSVDNHLSDRKVFKIIFPNASLNLFPTIIYICCHKGLSQRRSINL